MRPEMFHCSIGWYVNSPRSLPHSAHFKVLPPIRTLVLMSEIKVIPRLLLYKARGSCKKDRSEQTLPFRECRISPASQYQLTGQGTFACSSYPTGERESSRSLDVGGVGAYIRC